MRWLAGAATATLMTLDVAAFAQPASNAVDLAWSAPAECPPRAAVLAEVQAMLEGSAASVHPVAAAAAVERAGQRWRVALTIRSDQSSGARSIDADSCAALASAVALIVALAVDPTARSPANADAVATPPSSPPPPRPRPREETKEADGPRLALGAAVSGDIGTLPSPAIGGSVAVAGLYRRARVEARGRAYASQHAADPARPTQGVDLGYLGLDARACLAVIVAPGEARAAREGLTVSPCLGIDWSRISGSGFGGSKTFSGAGSWSALEAGVLAAWALASVVALRVGVDLLVPTSRPAFVVLAADGSTAESLHRPASIGGRVDVGVELRFW
ncbi:MAG: hypothetical protein NVS3B10_16470 [Polyangiales bacterium]